MSPTQLTLAQLRKDGYTARVVEQTIHAQGRVFKRDCFGYDVLAAKPDDFSGGDLVGVQACAASSHAARVAKLLANPEARDFLATGRARIEVWSWSTRRSLERTKAGKRSKRLVHHLRREEITLAMFVPQEQTRGVELVCMKCGEPWCFHPRPGCNQEQTREAL